MTSVLVVVSIEMFFASKGAGHMHSTEHNMLQVADGAFGAGHRVIASTRIETDAQNSKIPSLPKRQTNTTGVSPGLPSSSQLMWAHSSWNSAGRMIPNGQQPYGNMEGEDSDVEFNDLDSHIGRDSSPFRQERREETESFIRPAQSAIGLPYHVDAYDAQNPETEQQQEKKLLLQCLLLEAGILFHSVFIGMALSVATGTSFIVLFIAISFHRKKPFHFLIDLAHSSGSFVYRRINRVPDRNL